ncbi:MAG: integrase [Candidatus Acidiferrales bacterium]
MAIYRRGKFYWYSFVYKSRRVQASTKVSNIKDARDIERAAWTRLARNEVALPDDSAEKKEPTIGELLDALQKDFELRGIYSAKNKSNFKMARAAFPETMLASKLAPADVDAYVGKRQKKDAAPATINRALGLVAQAFKRAKKRGEIERVPEFRHLSEKGNARKGFFEGDEFSRFIEHLPEDLRDFCRFAYITGWRKNEIASLRWSDIEGDVLRLRGENAKNREARSLVLTGELAQIIERRKKLRIVSGVMAEFVFHRDGQPVQEFRKAWASACKKAGLAGKLFHDFRRTAVRDMVRSGVPQSVAMKISGHKTASMFRRYDITDERDLRDAVLSVEAYRAKRSEKVVSMVN